MQNRLKEIFGEGPVLCDGAMGTSLYDRGVFLNRCFDELNLTQPDLVRAVHEDYLRAGAEVIETNTFGANPLRLARYGLADKVAAINAAGVNLARAAVALRAEKQAEKAWVAGAVGPLGVRISTQERLATQKNLALRQDSPAEAERPDTTPDTKPDTTPDTISPEQAYEAFAEQMQALALAGADLLILETIPSMAEAEQALRAARDHAPQLPIIVMVTVDEESRCLDGTSPEVAAARITGWGADAVGVNCSTGPAAVLTAVERMAEATDLPLAAMPNAGMPRAVEGRNLYLCSPEYMGSFARKFFKAGVQFLGGCCGTTPKHIRTMRSFLRAEQVQQSAMPESRAEVLATNTPPAPLEQRSGLGRRIKAREFVTMVEIVPPRGVDCRKEVEGAAMLASLGVPIINVPDSPRASARMSAMSLCLQIEQKARVETLLHYTCRDRNLLGIQSDLLGASSMGLRNLLCLTGDPPKLGNYPEATAVFDVDAIGLLNMVRRLNHGLDLGSSALGGSTQFTLGCAANPGVADLDNEVRRFEKKVEAGAEYAITQPVFDLRLLEVFLKRIEGFRIPVIAGIWPLSSLRNAEFMKNDLKVSVPDEILLRMQAATTPEEAREVGIKVAQEMLATVRPLVEGVQVSAPFGRYRAAADVLADALPNQPDLNAKENSRG